MIDWILNIYWKYNHRQNCNFNCCCENLSSTPAGLPSPSPPLQHAAASWKSRPSFIGTWGRWISEMTIAHNHVFHRCWGAIGYILRAGWHFKPCVLAACTSCGVSGGNTSATPNLPNPAASKTATFTLYFVCWWTVLFLSAPFCLCYAPLYYVEVFTEKWMSHLQITLLSFCTKMFKFCLVLHQCAVAMVMAGSGPQSVTEQDRESTNGERERKEWTKKVLNEINIQMHFLYFVPNDVRWLDYKIVMKKYTLPLLRYIFKDLTLNMTFILSHP